MKKYRGMKVELYKNEVGKAERQSGVMLMNVKDMEENLYRLEQTKVMTGKVRSSPFSRRDIEIIYRERLISSVGYFLPITQFTVKQCKVIQSPFFNTITVSPKRI